jgi:hypothetical protein
VKRYTGRAPCRPVSTTQTAALELLAHLHPPATELRIELKQFGVFGLGPLVLLESRIKSLAISL